MPCLELRPRLKSVVCEEAARSTYLGKTTDGMVVGVQLVKLRHIEIMVVLLPAHNVRQTSQPDPCRRTHILGDCLASAFAQASCQNVNQNAKPAGPRSFGESSFVTTVRLLKPSVMHNSTLAQCQNLCLPARIESAHAPDTFEETHVHPATPSSTTPAGSQVTAS
jgi:hypothetical protein